MGGEAPLQAAIRRVRALPAPRVPPPGPVDIAVGRLLHRIAPFQPGEIAALNVLLGLDGEPPSPGRAARTLIPAGCDPAAQHRPVVTARERFRYRGQELRALARCCGAPPSLLTALDMFAALAPCPAEQASDGVYQTGLTSRPLTAPAVLALADLFDLTAAVRLGALSGQPVWLLPAAEHNTLLAGARQLLTRTFHPYTLNAAQIGAWGGQPHVLAALAGLPPAPGAQHSWLTVGRTLALPIRRCLAVTGPLNSAEIHAALRRCWYHHPIGDLPDLDTLTAWLHHQDWLHRTTSGHWQLAPGVRVHWHHTDRVWIPLLQPGLAAYRKDLINAAVAAGIPTGSAAIAYGKAPYLRTTGRGTVQLRTSQQPIDVTTAERVTATTDLIARHHPEQPLAARLQPQIPSPIDPRSNPSASRSADLATGFQTQDHQVRTQ